MHLLIVSAIDVELCSLLRLISSRRHIELAVHIVANGPTWLVWMLTSSRVQSCLLLLVQLRIVLILARTDLGFILHTVKSYWSCTLCLRLILLAVAIARLGALLLQLVFLLMSSEIGRPFLYASA